jgi:hypothetical protein
MVGSDSGEHGFGRAGGCSIDGVHQPFTYTPLFACSREYLLSVRRCRKEAKILKIKAAGSKSQFKMRTVHSGILRANCEIVKKRLMGQDALANLGTH